MEAGGVGSRKIVMSRKRYILAIRRNGRQVRAQLQRDWQSSEYNLSKIDSTTSIGNFGDQFDGISGRVNIECDIDELQRASLWVACGYLRQKHIFRPGVIHNITALRAIDSKQLPKNVNNEYHHH